MYLSHDAVGWSTVYGCGISCSSRQPNDQMLNIWLNIKNNCCMKKIKNRAMSCNSLWIPAFVVLIRAQKVFSLGHIYFARDKHVPVEIWYTYHSLREMLI